MLNYSRYEDNVLLLVKRLILEKPKAEAETKKQNKHTMLKDEDEN